MKSFLKFYMVLITLNKLGRINEFVQVGVHDGEMHDPLRQFILNNNWHGLLIEPQKEGRFYFYSLNKEVMENYLVALKKL